MNHFVPRRLLALSVIAALAAPLPVLAQSSKGRIKGRVTDAANGNPLPGVTVTVTSPALLGEQTEFTDDEGNYLITELPTWVLAKTLGAFVICFGIYQLLQIWQLLRIRRARGSRLAATYCGILGGLIGTLFTNLATLATGENPQPVTAILFRPSPDGLPYRRLTAEAISRETPGDAIVISGLDPVFLSPFLMRGSSRIVIPASRSLEYASKRIAPTRIGPLDPPARGPYDHRAPGLVKYGAIDPCPIVATEARAAIPRWIAEGHRVFVDTTDLPHDGQIDRYVDEDRLTIVPNPRFPWLLELRLR